MSANIKMPIEDSMFLLEIVVEELKSFISCKEFYIRSQFADVFKLPLRDPNGSDPLMATVRRRPKKRIKVRDENTSEQKPPPEGKVQSGQSILFASPIMTLITTMKNHPIEITFYDKNDRRKQVGSVDVPWSPIYIDYLYLLATKTNASPIVIRGGHNVYDDTTSKCVATIMLNIKLTCLRDKRTIHGRTLAIPNQKLNCQTIFKSKPATPALAMIGDQGTIKTVYSGGKKKKKTSHKSKTKNNSAPVVIIQNANIKNSTKPDVAKEENALPLMQTQNKNANKKIKMTQNMLHIVKSGNNLSKKFQNDVVETKSCSFIDKKQFKFANYMFGDNDKPLEKQVFCVGYFTVENDFQNSSSSKVSSPKDSISSKSSPTGSASDTKWHNAAGIIFKECNKDCTKQRDSGKCEDKICDNVDNKISVKQCDKVRCNVLEKRKLPLPPNETIHLDLATLKKDRYDGLGQVIENVVGGMKAKMKYDEKKCFCECECTFGFVKRTTYCTVCGGYEKPGEDLPKTAQPAPFPCPIYHKLIDKNKQKSTSGSDRSKMCDSKSSTKKVSKSQVNQTQSPKTSKSPVNQVQSPKQGKSSAPPGSAPAAASTNVESDKENSRKKQKEKKDDRFKFNYGYTGIPPKIGHTKCATPCTGTLSAVPKSMGWLWTAEDVPGMKFRPSWKPGCVHKHVLHLLRMAKDPGIILSKKKRKPEKQKKPLKRPLITIAKKDGEYTVTMETMKAYAKPRALNQQPYEDKPVLTYKIGRTEEENRERQKRKERELRRLQRDQRAFIQSAFTDMCKEICLKTYQQALGFLPDTETPDCSCYPNRPGPEDTNLDRSCSCSEHDVSFGSDTDLDEWLVEFTPPTAHFDPTFKGKKIIKQDNESQYSYLDYRVKLLDRSGNQVVRFFKGPDGKTQCSDLGGFWSPEHKWLEINIDGFIGPDNKWAPVIFTGPQGDQIECETGKFQDANGTWLTVGVDGYVDATGKWKFYPKSKARAPQKKVRKKFTKDVKDDKTTADNKPSGTYWSCFGDASPKEISKLGILGHGIDKKLLLQRLTDMLAQGEDIKIPEPSMVPRLPASKRDRRKGNDTFESSFYSERSKCNHRPPSEKGIVAVDGHGNKTYFRLKNYNNKRPGERLAYLEHHGISTSSFHIPCLSSFINSEILKKQQYEKFMKNRSTKYDDMEYGTATKTKDATTQAQYRYRYAL